MRQRLAYLVGFAAVGFVFGVADAHLPAPHEARVFWVGNLSSLWIVLPFFAGRAQRSPIWAILAGGVTCVAAVTGFYAFGSLHRAIGFVAYWLVLAGLAGPLYGMLGGWWARSRSLVAGLAVGLPFVFEPWLVAARYGYLPRPYPLWVAEVAVGAAILAWFAGRRRRTSLA